MLFCDPQTCFTPRLVLSEMLANGPWLSLCGQAFHTLHFNLLFLINTRFRWHLFWQIFGLQPGTRGYGPAEELSCGSKPQLVRTTLVCSHQDPSALWDKPPTSPARATAPPALLPFSPPVHPWSPQVPRVEFRGNDWPCFVVGEAALLSLVRCGDQRIYFYLPSAF